MCFALLSRSLFSFFFSFFFLHIAEKTFFHNMPFSIDDEFHVSVVTPVVHYSMGGVQINARAEIVRPSADQSKFGEPIKGLFAAGEVAGGVHGKNRLGGSGLLGCVVYGRVAGDSASQYLLTQLTESSGSSSAQQVNRRVGGLLNQLQPGSFSITVNPNQNSFTVQLSGGGGGQGGDASDLPNEQQHGGSGPNPSGTGKSAVGESTPKSSPVSGSAPAKAAAAAPAAASKKEYTYDEVAKHNTEKDCWCVVNGDVLDVTKFLDVHPGGKHAILLFAGKEASEEFNMIHKGVFEQMKSTLARAWWDACAGVVCWALFVARFFGPFCSLSLFLFSFLHLLCS